MFNSNRAKNILTASGLLVIVLSLVFMFSAQRGRNAGTVSSPSPPSWAADDEMFLPAPTEIPTPTPPPIPDGYTTTITGTTRIVVCTGKSYRKVLSGPSGQVDCRAFPGNNVFTGEWGLLIVGQRGITFTSGSRYAEVSRAVLSFDTSFLDKPPAAAILRLTLVAKSKGALPLEIYPATLTGEETAANLWVGAAGAPLTTFLDSHTKAVGVGGGRMTIDLPLPPQAVQPGGVTRFLFKTTLEGSEPAYGSEICEACQQAARLAWPQLLLRR